MNSDAFLGLSRTGCPRAGFAFNFRDDDACAFARPVGATFRGRSGSRREIPQRLKVGHCPMLFPRHPSGVAAVVCSVGG